ncbi:MAG TPA: SAM-dependent methyltransferase [Cytophagaceae bacterium]|jgi:hypothetical protein|nr:SAM-dependent methyltransferase [Cytophagaceae bacterium]
MKELTRLFEQLKSSISAEEFVKITISKPKEKKAELHNVYIRLIIIKNKPHFSFTYHYKTKDLTKNFAFEDGYKEMATLLQERFSIATLFTIHEDFKLIISDKGVNTFTSHKPTFSETESYAHDKPKIKRAANTNAYLTSLGIMDYQGKMIPKMADKYRQINKYLEIIESLIGSTDLPSPLTIVDMGSGKGYLTFALYDYLKNKLNLEVTITGIELRKDLTDYCNEVAKQCLFDGLNFLCEPIQEYKENKIDILIALHACDTATDDAIYKGIISNASLIICAPCCHKQIRQQVKGIEQENPLLKYGIFKERQFEMVTDTIRALLMEENQYQTKIFEFISNEHTRKNILMVGSKTTTKVNKEPIAQKIETIKTMFHIKYHYLETLLQP